VEGDERAGCYTLLKHFVKHIVFHETLCRSSVFLVKTLKNYHLSPLPASWHAFCSRNTGKVEDIKIEPS
jgi:hypothetical protein